jgi:3-dehydroquinate synthase
MVLPSGEASKSWAQLERLVRAMLDAGLSRDSAVVAVGGGMVCDIASFAASIYMRGCELILVPSTLLAMVDAALGGKTSVNLGGYKNIIGTFFPAREVRLDAELLFTLPQREYLSGLAEVIKTAMLGDAELLDMLQSEMAKVDQRNDELLSDAVWRCVMVKGRIVETDLRESAERLYLNLGHTFGHALESVSGLGVWTHGEAVAWGLAQAMTAGVAAGITAEPYAHRILAILNAYGYRIEPVPQAADRLIEAMWRDKKVRAGKLRFVLQHDVGDTRVLELDEALVRSVLRGEQVING